VVRKRAKRKTKRQIAGIKAKLERYIKKTRIPIVTEFAYQNDVRREFLYTCEELKHTIKKLIEKKESQLERLALDKEIDKSMAIFSLKQLGWKDVQETNLNVNASEIAREFAQMVSAAGTGKAT